LIVAMPVLWHHPAELARVAVAGSLGVRVGGMWCMEGSWRGAAGEMGHAPRNLTTMRGAPPERRSALCSTTCAPHGTRGRRRVAPPRTTLWSSRFFQQLSVSQRRLLTRHCVGLGDGLSTCLPPRSHHTLAPRTRRMQRRTESREITDGRPPSGTVTAATSLIGTPSITTGTTDRSRRLRVGWRSGRGCELSWRPWVNHLRW